MIPFRVEPLLSERVWGGRRLGPPGTLPIGEAWVAGPTTRVATGPEAGSPLDDLAARHGVDLVGTRAPRPDGFPLLVKLLDPAAWLSVQVHPDDVTARRLEGPSAVGKTEAWYVLEATAGAAILLGARPDVDPDAIRAAIAGGTGGVAELLERRLLVAGDAYLVPAGTLHAVGPGGLLYEIQQPSDLTYRVDDWGRPPTPERPLHTRQALASVLPERRPGVVRIGDRAARRGSLVACDQFVLEHLDPTSGGPVTCDPDGASVHILTVASGAALVSGLDWRERLGHLETLVVPATAGPYVVAVAQEPAAGAAPTPHSRVLLARLPRPSVGDR